MPNLYVVYMIFSISAKGCDELVEKKTGVTRINIPFSSKANSLKFLITDK